MASTSHIIEIGGHRIRTRWSATQWIWTLLLLCFIVVAVCGKLDWWPVLLPSAILTWYGAVRTVARSDSRGQD